MIHLLDRNEQIIDTLVNPSKDKLYTGTKMTEGIANNLLTFEFDTTSKIAFEDVFKLTAQDQDGNHRLFFMSSFDKSHNGDGIVQSIQAQGDHILLGLEPPIAPTRLVGATLETAGAFALASGLYQLGRVDFMSTQNIEITQYMTPLALLQQIQAQFGCVIKFRVELVGNIFVRYVDLLQPADVFNGKELVMGKDITGLDRKQTNSDIITRMIGEAYDADGNLVSFADINGGRNFVESTATANASNINGRYRYGIYQYQQQGGGEIDKQQMLDATRAAFNAANKPTVAYQVTEAALEQLPGYDHERIRLYDTVRIIDELFDPALFLEAQTTQTIMPELDDKSGDFTVEFGDYRVVNVKLSKQVDDLQSQVIRRSPVWDGSGAKADAAQQAASDAQESADKATQQVVNLGKAVDGKSTILASPTEPTDTTSFWIDTSEALNVLKHFDTSTGTWVKASATDFIDLGGQVVTDQIAPKAVTVDQMDVKQLSAIAADIGEITAGILRGIEIDGATIQSIIDAKNFLQIVGNHLHIEGDDGPDGSYIVFDVKPGLFNLEFGRDPGDGRIPTGVLKATSREIVITDIEQTGDGITFDPSNAIIYFGTDVLKNRAFITVEGAPDADTDGFDIYIQPTGKGAIRALKGDAANTYADAYFNTLFTTAFEANPESPANNIYTRPKSGGIHLVTLAGTTNVLMEIRAARFTMSSHEKFKANITPWTDSVWDAIKSTGLYSYNLKDDLSQGIQFKHYGVIFGDGYGAPSMVSLPDGEHLDEHNYTSLTLKGVQELMFKVDEQQQEIDDLKTRVDKQDDVIKDLTSRLEALEGQK